MCILFVDPFGKKDKQFAIAGWNDTDAKSATTFLISPGFKAKEHPHECLNFFYYIQVHVIPHLRRDVCSCLNIRFISAFIMTNENV